MSPLTIDFSQGNQLENKGKVREIRILKLVATLQTLELIKVENIDIKQSGLQIKITELIKTSKPGKN